MTTARRPAETWPYPSLRDFEKTLRTAGVEWFAACGHETRKKMKYVLARWEDWPRNIVVPEVADYVLAEKARCEREAVSYPLHKYLHHALSSQAAVFNLLGPLIVRDDLEPLRLVLEALGVTWPGAGATAAFEFNDRSVFNEAAAQPTSVDAVVKDAEGKPRIFIEAKLTEPEFGGCSVFRSGDCDGRSPAEDHGLCYLHHRGRRYWERMDELGFSGLQHGQRQCVLAAHYQFFREVMLALTLGGTFVLLSDRRSPVFHAPAMDDSRSDRGLMPFLLENVPEVCRDRVVSISVQEVIDATEATGRHDDWVGAYRAKYGLERDVEWVEGPASPNRSRVLWVRPAAESFVSMTADPTIAEYFANGSPISADLSTCLPNDATEAKIDWEFDEEELRRIRAGFQPQDMGEKWKIEGVFTGSATRVSFFRSWTGQLDYVLELDGTSGRRLWHRAAASPAPAASARAILDGYLLDRPCIAPAPADLGDDESSLVAFGISFAGTKCDAVEPASV